jgi:hypothetical protein
VSCKACPISNFAFVQVLLIGAKLNSLQTQHISILANAQVGKLQRNNLLVTMSKPHRQSMHLLLQMNLNVPMESPSSAAETSDLEILRAHHAIGGVRRNLLYNDELFGVF